MAIDISDLLRAAGGEMVGRVRLQKSVYLLDQMGMDSGLSFDYHHYGPYSAELSDELDDEVVFGEIEEEARRRSRDGVPYSVFRVRNAQQDHGSTLGKLPWTEAQNALSEMEKASATVLELAATIHWLAFVERVDDWQAELFCRKGVKTRHGRDRRALQLLRKLGLDPKLVSGQRAPY